MKIMELNEETDDLESEVMTEAKFWGMAMEDEDEDFDYGRDFLKDGNYDQKLEHKDDGCMPYESLPLFLQPDGT